MEKTLQQYDLILGKCRDIFTKKMTDYGVSWRILRPSSLTDQLYIKALRIRSIEEKGAQKVEDGVETEFLGIVNYCTMALIQLEHAPGEKASGEQIREWYEKSLQTARDLMMRKNHDYGEAWRKMRVSSMTDLILMKLLRIKQIEDNAGQTLISEGLDANYLDIINYAIFALILLTEKNS